MGTVMASFSKFHWQYHSVLRAQLQLHRLRMQSAVIVVEVMAMSDVHGGIFIGALSFEWQWENLYVAFWATMIGIDRINRVDRMLGAHFHFMSLNGALWHYYWWI